MSEQETPDNTEETPAAPEAEAPPTETATPAPAEAEAAPMAAAPEPEEPAPQSAMRSSAFMGVPIEVLISVGKARPLVSDLVKLRRDSVLSLDTRIDDPVELYVGDKLIARGELQEMDDQSGRLGVRLTEVADLSNGV